MSGYKPTAKEIKELRSKTLAGFQDCQKALAETSGDISAAEEIIRKKGLQVAAKKAHREAAEGLIVARIDEDKNSGAMAEVNIETDFAAKGDPFLILTTTLVNHVLAAGPDGITDGQETYGTELAPDGGKTVKELIDEAIGQIRENISLKRVARFRIDGPGVIHAYIHPPGKVGVLIELGCENEADKQKCDELAHELTLQIAFSDPSYVKPEAIPEEVLAKERELAEAKAREQGKPDHIVPKIAEGMLRKYYTEECLLEQPFAKEPKQLVKDIIKQAGIAGVEVRGFARFALK